MRVRQLMTSPAITVAPDTPIQDVVDTLLTNDISGVPVVDPEGHLLGVVSEADIISKEAYGYRRRRALALIADHLRGHDPKWVRKASGRTAEDIMTTRPVSISPEDGMEVAARRMLEHHHKRLPVTDGDRVVGVVTRHDLLAPFHRTDAEIAGAVEQMLADPLRAPEDHHVRVSVASGVVTLDGSAHWPSDAVVLEAIVARMPGVIAVENRIVARERDQRPYVPPFV